MEIGQVDPEIICLNFFQNEGVHADDPLKLRSYWVTAVTQVHQIYIQYR